MTAIDFANSYMTWFPESEGDNIARIQLDAACTLIDEQSGQEETCYLIAPCRSEVMYRDGRLFQMPNYEFCGIWSQDEFLIIRTHWVSDRDNRQHGINRKRWADVRLDIRRFLQVDTLLDDAQIVQATLANRPLIARTVIRDEQRCQRAILEYPVKTMNILREPPRFQVDTGPLIVPNFASTALRLIERLEMAHVAYNVFDKAEFILRQPTPLGQGDQSRAATTDYSVVQVVSARNEILAAPCGE